MMFTLLYTFLLGVGVAIVSSIPVGPLTMSVVQTSLNRGTRAAMMMGIGGIIIEIFFCLISLFGFRWLTGGADEAGNTVLDKLYLATIPILIILGIFAIKNRHKEHDSKGPQRKAHGSLLLGATLCISNPVLFGYWLWATNSVQSWRWMGSTSMEFLMFTAGVASGIFLFFFVVVKLTARSQKKMSLKTRGKINLVFGIFFICFACYLAIKFFFLK